jgi:hypothetical protein
MKTSLFLRCVNSLLTQIGFQAGVSAGTEYFSGHLPQYDAICNLPLVAARDPYLALFTNACWYGVSRLPTVVAKEARILICLYKFRCGSLK